MSYALAMRPSVLGCADVLAKSIEAKPVTAPAVEIVTTVPTAPANEQLALWAA